MELIRSHWLSRASAVFYEYGLTWTREVRQYWNRPLDIPSALFFANRYLCLASRVVILVGITSDPSKESCSLLVWCSEIYAVIALLIITLLSALRVYALWYGTVWPSLLVVMCGLILPFVSIAIMTLCVREALSNPVACNPSLHAGTTAFAVYFAARAIGIVSDILVVAFTWVKARRLMASTRAVGFTAYVPEALLRFGLHYFAAATFFNILLLNLALASYVTINTSDYTALVAIIMSRFMLALRQSVYKSRVITQTTRQSDPMIGNMGEDIEYDTDSDDDVSELAFGRASGLRRSTQTASDSLP